MWHPRHAELHCFVELCEFPSQEPGEVLGVTGRHVAAGSARCPGVLPGLLPAHSKALSPVRAGVGQSLLKVGVSHWRENRHGKEGVVLLKVPVITSLLPAWSRPPSSPREPHGSGLLGGACGGLCPSLCGAAAARSLRAPYLPCCTCHLYSVTSAHSIFFPFSPKDLLFSFT